MFRWLIEIPYIWELWEVRQWKKRQMFVEDQVKVNNQQQKPA